MKGLKVIITAVITAFVGLTWEYLFVSCFTRPAPIHAKWVLQTGTTARKRKPPTTTDSDSDFLPNPKWKQYFTISIWVSRALRLQMTTDDVFDSRREYERQRENKTEYDGIVQNLAKWQLLYDEDEVWTEWICSIRNAKVYLIQSNNNKGDEGWLKDKKCIQIKRMSVLDLARHYTNFDLPSSEHFYDNILDVVKLPMAIPGFAIYEASQFLFLRPDDYQLFYLMQRSTVDKRFVLLGNPGISKSWFHYKYILFCFHPEIYNTFRPLSIKEDESTVVLKNTMGKFKRKKIPHVKKLQEIETTPDVIVRTIAGVKSQIFFVNTNDSVILVKHFPDDLEDFTTGMMTILWEPGRESTAVPFIGIEARMIITASPLLTRFKEFKKHFGVVLHMPCPSLAQLRLMGRILRTVIPEYIHLDVDILKITRKYGPFIRLAVVKRKGNAIGAFIAERETELNNLKSADLIKLTRQNEHVMRIEETKQIGFSHRLARYFVRRDDEDDFYGYAIPRYCCASPGAFDAIDNKITLPDIATIIDILVDINRSGGKASSLEDFNYKMFERLVESYVQTSGLTWHCCAMPMKKNNSRYSRKGTLQIARMEIVRTVTRYDEMEVGRFYYPSFRFFPLVDMYWKDENGELFAIQVSISLQHPKSESVFKSFFKILGLKPTDVRLNLHYLILPFRKEQLKYIEYPKSYFYKDNITQNFGENIRFYALCPPKTFEPNVTATFDAVG